jgi:transcriptional regulator with XRE-family HTH domain
MTEPSPSDVATEDAAWLHVGVAIRQRRQAFELTLVDLAELTTLSQPFLSQVENGRARPSMSSLHRIARALRTTPQALFGGPAAADGQPSVVRHEAAAAIAVTAAPGTAAVSMCRLLIPGDAPFHVVELDGLPPEFLEHWEHDGFEAAYVVAGEVEIEIDGEVTRLAPGDLAAYSARLPHRHRSVSSVPARLLLIETKVERVQDTGPVTHAAQARQR